MKNSGITGHEKQMEDLLRDLASDNLSHAYLFSGQPHLGKFSIAKWFSRKILTAGLAEEEKEKTVRQLKKLIHPDLLVLDKLWIEGQNENWEQLAKYSNVSQIHRSKKEKAKTDTISIDDIRALQERLYERGLSRHTCLLIRSVERMQAEAVNSLLKIIEEPPQGVVFIMTTQQSASLLPTLVSRCRVINFHRLSAEQIDSLLTDMDNNDVSFIHNISQGAPGIACALRDDADLLLEHKLCHQKMVNFWKLFSFTERLKLLEPLKNRDETADRLLLHLGLTLRNQPDLTFAKPLSQLQQDLQTNVYRQLAIENFVFAVTKK